MPARCIAPSTLAVRGTASAIILAAILSGCGQAQGGQGGGGFPPPFVTFETVTPKDVPVDFEFVGQTAGSREVEIRARVTGILEKRLYQEGTRVKAGQPLFSLERATYAANAATADANVATADAKLKQAEREYNRLKPLIEAKAVSQQDYDNAASNYDLARAGLKAAQAQANAAHVDLEYTEVRAPITGVVGRALKEEGSLANASGDSLLATMAQTDPMYVNFALSDSDRERVQTGSGELKLPASGYTVKLKTADGRVLEETGKLDFSDYKADGNTGAYSSRAIVANAKNNIAPGQFLRVVLSGAIRPNAIAVPQRAVLDGPTGKFVYVVGKGQDGKPIALPHPVVPGEWVKLDGKESNGWVIKQGLNAGDNVIVDGTARIFFPGAPIVPQTPEEAAKMSQQPMGPAGAKVAGK